MNELFGSHSPVSKLRVKLCCRMLGQYSLSVRPALDPAFDTIANSHYHVAKRLDRRAICHFSSCGYNVETAIGPPIKRVHQTVELCLLVLG